MAEYVTSIKTKQGNKRIDYNALANLPSLEANNITYDNSSTKLTATNTQAALDEIVAQMQGISTGMDLSTLTIQVEKSTNGQKLIFNDGINEKSVEIPILVDASFNLSSSNPVQNKTVTTKFNEIKSTVETMDATLKTIVDEYITDSDLSAKGYLTSIPSEYVTETELANKNYLTSVPSEYVTETELINKKYLTSIPSEYVTETELNAKGYLTDQDISNKANKATTLSGYGITDGATKTEFNQLSQSVDNLKIDESDLTEILEEVLVL